MTFVDWIQLALFIVLILGITPLLGSFLAAVFEGNRHLMRPVFGWLERSVYRICHIDAEEEMDWKQYVKAMLWFNLFGFLFLFLLQLFQSWLPLNPQNVPAVEWTSAFNTAVSFVSNTNWQGYTPENTMSYLTQMMGLAVQNFVSAATGMAVLIALIRGLSRNTTNVIGNFWTDLTRTTVYILLPLSIAFALILVGQGVIQNFKPYVHAETLQNESQTIPMGPAASQIAIKQLGTNGGGFFNANSAHPFENPTPLSNFLETFAIFMIPAASVYMFGRMVKSQRHAWIVFIVMFLLWISGLAVALISETMSNPIMAVNPVLEGKETRIGAVDSILWAVTTTGTSNGSVNSMHSSLSPLAGGVAMFNMMVGEVIWGGVGVGLAGMIHFILLTVFIAGLMVGRTPEYLGKKIEKREMQWVVVAIITPCATILLGAGIAAVLPNALASLGNAGPHGLSEILYAFASSSGNNGSAFAGLNANTYFYNLVLGFVMLITRLAILIPSLAVAGCLAEKKTMAPSLGTFSTATPLFGVLLIAIILIVAALTFFPALSLGPIVEQFLMLRGQTF